MHGIMILSILKNHQNRHFSIKGARHNSKSPLTYMLKKLNSKWIYLYFRT